MLEAAYKQTLTDLRPQLVAISELLPNINFPSTIGNEYGDIYEAQFAQAKNSIQNRGQIEFFNKHMKPVIQLGNVAPKL